MNLFLWNGKILVENAEPIGSLCAWELGKRLVFRSDFTVLVVMLQQVSVTAVLQCASV